MSNWKDKSTSVRKGEELDQAALEQYLLNHLPNAEGELVIEQFPGGFSNLTYLIRLGEQQLVLRRPPFGAKIKSAHDMSREYNILSSLMKIYDKVPRPLLFCEDESVLGAEFYVMERLHGVILRPKMPKEMHPKPELMKAISKELIQTFADYHNLDYKAAGLENFGKPNGYVERQIKGWSKRYYKSQTDDLPDIEFAIKWLNDNIRPESGVSLIHNDYKYDNVVLDEKDWSKIVAILDWEMATLGDPLMDLGTSVGYWINPNDPPAMQMMQLNSTTIEGNPTREEVVHQYALVSGREVGDFIFHYVYGLFKIAVIVQQIYYRYKHGYTNDKRFAGLIHAVKACGQMAKQAIQKKKIDNLY